jgi:hypothetical protein
MSEKENGWSEEKEGFFGDKYTQHYNSDGDKIGWSEEKEGFFGGTYTQHYDGDSYDKSSWSEEKEGFLGGTYTQNYEGDSYDKSSWSEEKEGFFGGTYSQHYEGDGYDKSGWSEEREGFFGGSYTQHYGSDQKTDDDSCRTDSTNSGSSLSSSNSSYSNVGYSLADSSYDSSSSNGGYSPADSDYDSSSSSGIGGLIAVAVFLAVVAFCGTAIWNGIKNGQSTTNQSSVTRNQTPKMARVIMTKANLRPNPNDNRKPIMKIDYDGKLQLLSPDYTGRGWYHVRHISSGKEGWIHGNTIEFVY